MVNEQSNALRLADALLMGDAMIPSIDLPEAAAELRRLHESNTELLEALKEVYDWCYPTDSPWAVKTRAAIANAERTTT